MFALDIQDLRDFMPVPCSSWSPLPPKYPFNSPSTPSFHVHVSCQSPVQCFFALAYREFTRNVPEGPRLSDHAMFRQYCQAAKNAPRTTLGAVFTRTLHVQSSQNRIDAKVRNCFRLLTLKLGTASAFSLGNKMVRT